MNNNNVSYIRGRKMAIIKGTFVCPSCLAGINTDDHKKPSECPSCKYRFGTVAPTSVFRLPKPLFQQYREIAKARMEVIPPMPHSDDSPEVGAPDPLKIYMESQKILVVKKLLEELVQFVKNMPESYIKDTVESLEFMVELLAFLSPQTRYFVSAKLKHMSSLADNIVQGTNLGVRYETTATRPISSTSDSGHT
jgi:hypothetical protein